MVGLERCAGGGERMEIIQPLLRSARSLSSAANFRGAAVRGRQVRVEERALEQVERIGAADDELAAPMEPIDERFLLLGREWFARIDFVPQDVGDAGPGERVVGQQGELVGAQFDDEVVSRVFGIVLIGFAVERRLHGIERFDVRIARRRFCEHDEVVLVRRHRG